MTVGVKVNIRDIERAVDKLEAVAEQSLPHATRNTLNSAAFDARKKWQDEIRGAFVLRNQWTERSIRVNKARGTNVRTMESAVGSVQPYMETQEKGGKTNSEGISRAPI